MTVPPLVWAVFGAVFGSFFNVVIYRVPRRLSIVSPGSACPHCSHELTAKELIPVLSYLVQRGRCRVCGTAISIQYPLVELAAALGFGISGAVGQTSGGQLTGSVFFSLLLLCFMVDLQTQRIPNVFVVPGMIFGLIAAAAGWGLVPIVDAAIGLGVSFTVLFLIHILSRGAMGMGDVKMLAMIGSFLGPIAALITLFGASFLGAVIGSFYLWRTKQGRKTPIPFGPFLAAAAWLIWLYPQLGLPLPQWLSLL